MVSEGTVIEALTQFFEERWREQVEDFAYQYPDSKILDVDYLALTNFRRELDEQLETDPKSVLDNVVHALNKLEYGVDVEFKGVSMRLTGYTTKTPIREIRQNHILKYIKVEGIIRRASDVKPRMAEIAFQCRRCGHVSILPQTHKKVVEPLECENNNCGKKGPFNIVHAQSTFQDFQILEIQESPDSLRGTQPRNLTVYCYDELTDVVTTGDKVMISGVLLTNQPSSREGKSTVLDTVLEANNIEKLDKSYDEIVISEVEKAAFMELSQDPLVKQKVIQSIAPAIYGYDDIKEALAMVLMSGVVKVTPDGTRLRGDIHILLIGDPGTAKSQLVKRIVDLSPRGVLNSGKSTTGVGLTAAVVKDQLNDDRWTLEGGSLVMADNGLCAIDELDKMRSEDVSSLHSAMEQQEIIVAKAGIHASLMTRCAVVGAANPVHGRFDKHDTDIGGQINMTPTILSRFDLIFIIQDLPNRDNDAKIASHISNNHMAMVGDSYQPISSEFLRKYVAYARANIEPKISMDARRVIEQFYVDVRSMQGGSDAIPITARSIDGLYRLSEASAKLRLSDTVTEQDAKDAIRLVSNCLKNVGYDEYTGKYNVDMIYAGGSRSQRSKEAEFKDYARSIEQFSVHDACKELNMDEITGTHILSILKREGFITSVGNGYYKVS